MFARTLESFVLLLGSAVLASATTPIVTVTSPQSNSVGSPVNYVASASSPECANGIAAMRIYTAPGVNAYTVNSSELNANINLPTGAYNTVVQAWDNCGGVGKTTVNITVSEIKLPPPRFLYATEYKAGRIAEYVVDPLTGSLTPTDQGWAWAHWGPLDIASDPGGYRLYVTNEGSHDLNAYFIYRDSGDLYQVPGSPFALTALGLRVVVHPSGRFVYATSSNSYLSTDINAFAVQDDGSLTPVPGSPFAQGGGAALAMDPAGSYLFASTSGGVAVYTIDQTSGALTPIPGSPFAIATYPGCVKFCSSGANDLAADPSGNYLYGLLGAQDAIAGFSIDRATGALTNLAGSPYAEGSFNTSNTPKAPLRLSVAPSGKFIYVANWEGESFSVFKLDATTGVPTYVNDLNSCFSSLAGLLLPETVAVDPSGSFVYTQGATNSGCYLSQGMTGALAGYSINQDSGYLFTLPGAPFPNPDIHTSTNTQEKVVVTR